MKTKGVMVVLLAMSLFASCTEALPTDVHMSKDDLMDKIKGGWAGQVIGCTYGGPTEFWYNGIMINDNIEIKWPDGHVKWYYDNSPGLYDDLYMDLTFVKVFEEEGLDAPIESFEKAFAYAEYPLWHANQQGRYNIINGITSPAAGYWEHNPHADDIDFQIEADFAGLMSPGMVNTSSYYCDQIGHMMNYGDGWYGGVYVAAMYALAFVSDDIEFIINEALKVIPENTRYHNCISDIIRWHKENPDHWEATWAMCQRKYSFEAGCPDGVYTTICIDAVINSAHIVTGLLYGGGDFGKTIDITTRCGDDSDCNPASAAGILGTMLGYSNIPEYWKKNIYEVEDRDFVYTDISLNDAYAMSYNHALQVIERNGGTVGENDVVIKCQQPEKVRYEQSFPGLWPKPLVHVNKEIRDVGEIAFDGKAVVVRYTFFRNWDEANSPQRDNDYVAEVEVYIDGKLMETVKLPVEDKVRKLDLYYNYNLEEGPHVMTFKWLNPEPDKHIDIPNCVVYGSK